MNWKRSREPEGVMSREDGDPYESWPLQACSLVVSFSLHSVIGPPNFCPDDKDDGGVVNPDQEKHHPTQHSVKGCHEFRHRHIVRKGQLR